MPSRMTFSTARSASVTGVRSALVVTTRSTARKRSIEMRSASAARARARRGRRRSRCSPAQRYLSESSRSRTVSSRRWSDSRRAAPRGPSSPGLDGLDDRAVGGVGQMRATARAVLRDRREIGEGARMLSGSTWPRPNDRMPGVSTIQPSRRRYDTVEDEVSPAAAGHLVDAPDGAVRLGHQGVHEGRLPDPGVAHRDRRVAVQRRCGQRIHRRSLGGTRSRSPGRARRSCRGTGRGRRDRSWS